MTRNLTLNFCLALCVVILLSSCTSSQIIDPSRRKNVSDDTKIVVFRADIDEETNFEIYAMRADKRGMDDEGSLVKRLTDTPIPAAEVFPTIARDGNTVVYCSSVNDLGGNPFFPDFDLFMVKIDTGEITSITDTGREREYAPSISGDGKVLTFMVDSFGRQAGDLYMMNLDKPNDRILIQENLSKRSFPHISADGKYVIYSAPAGKTKKMDIFILRLETREVINMTRTPDLEEVYPDFSDDRNLIVFELKDGDDKPAATPPAETAAPPAEKPAETEGESGNDGGTLIAQAETATTEQQAENPIKSESSEEQPADKPKEAKKSSG